MQRQPRNPTLRERIERRRGQASGRPQPPIARSARRRRVPRREIEARRQRLVRWGVGIAGALVALILIGGIAYDQVIKPRQVLATVGNVDIRRQDYWKVRAVDLWQQATQYQQFASFVGPDQQQQYLQAAQDALRQIDTVWGSTDVDDGTLSRMIDDQVYLQNLGQLGLEVTDQDVETDVLNQFAPADAPLITPTPTATLIPARVEMATQTAVARMLEEGAPTSAPIPSPPGQTPIAVAASPVAGSPVAASPAATPAGSPTVAPTPNPDQARATAEAGFGEFRNEFLTKAHLSREDYERLIARPAVARQKVDAAIAAQVGQSAEQVHAAHILVATEDLAREIHDQVTTGGADFAQVARERSTDESTAGNGGDLGWFAREEVVPAFADVAFALAPGQVSEPFQTEYGWHVVKVYDRADDRPLTDQQITRIRQARVDRWLADRKAAMQISSQLAPTPTPAAETFQPPVGAPPPPPPTPTPAASPVASPVASPAASPEPGATPAAAP